MVSVVILFTAPSYTSNNFGDANDLDSLITSVLRTDLSIEGNYRRYEIEVDSSFTRIVYRVPVHPSFSKTMFHFGLHKELSKFEIETPARVVFPERDMNIYIYDSGTIRSTIRLVTTEPKADDQ